MSDIREQLEESQKVCYAATEGPWEARGGYQSVNVTVKDDGDARIARFGDPLDTQQWKNATFIAHVRATLPLRNAQLAAVLDCAESWELQATCEGTINAVWAEAIKHCAEHLRRAIEDAAL